MSDTRPDSENLAPPGTAADASYRNEAPPPVLESGAGGNSDQQQQSTRWKPPNQRASEPAGSGGGGWKGRGGYKGGNGNGNNRNRYNNKPDYNRNKYKYYKDDWKNNRNYNRERWQRTKIRENRPRQEEKRQNRLQPFAGFSNHDHDTGYENAPYFDDDLANPVLQSSQIDSVSETQAPPPSRKSRWDCEIPDSSEQQTETYILNPEVQDLITHQEVLHTEETASYVQEYITKPEVSYTLIEEEIQSTEPEASLLSPYTHDGEFVNLPIKTESNEVVCVQEKTTTIPPTCIPKPAAKKFKPNLINSRNSKRPVRTSISEAPNSTNQVPPPSEVHPKRPLRTSISETPTSTSKRPLRTSISETPTSPNQNLPPSFEEQPQLPPRISLAPISKLIKDELQDIYLSIQAQEESGPVANDCDTLAEKLVNRVAEMDMVSIKNVINNPVSKFDAALKLQARRRLGEELRKQLKASNQENLSNTEIEPQIEPDAMVDAMNIPELLEQIRKALGIEFLEETGLEFALGQAEITEIEPEKVPESLAAITEEGQKEKEIEPPPKAYEIIEATPDLMSRIRNLEIVKASKAAENTTPPRRERISSTTVKKSPKETVVSTTPPKAAPLRKSKKIPKKAQPQPSAVLVISTSGSSSSDSSDSSSSDSDSSTSSNSSTSTSSSYKRRQRRKKLSEENVVNNFKNLILPNLSTAQQRRYAEKYSKSTYTSLMFIYELCANNKNGKLSTLEKKSLKTNLKSANNDEALQFLMKNILNLVKEQKTRDKDSKRKNQRRKTTTTTMVHESSSSTPNRISSTTVKINGTTMGNPIENKDRNKKSKNAESAVSTVGDDNETRFARDNGIVAVAGGGRSNADASKTASNVYHVYDSHSESYGSETDTDNVKSRAWKSAGEKKCIQQPDNDIYSLLPPLPSMNTLNLPTLPSSDILAAQNVKLIEAMQPKYVSDALLSNLKELDMKLMEVQRRKIYIDDMILKLQRDKMETDLLAMRLQNEKFLLLNAAVAQNNVCMAPNQIKLECNGAEEAAPRSGRKRPESFTTPFSEKLRNRKKRCQRDILIEEAFSATQSGIETVSTRKTRSQTNQSEAPAVVGVVHPIDSDGDDAEPEPEPAYDYSGIESGCFEGFKLPISQIHVVREFVIAASEDGNLYKFNIRTKELESKFSKHTEAVTQVMIDSKSFIYSASLDGLFKKTSVENFGLELQSVNIHEPIQSFDIQWDIAYLGSRWGNIFTYNLLNNKLSQTLLCSVGSSVMVLKATKEGPRKILIVSSKGNEINFRDATSGLLLRSLDLPNHLHSNNLLLSQNQLFCATQKNQIYQYDFSTGKNVSILNCGNGVASMKFYKERFIIVGCYDGFVYVLDKITTCQIGRFPGSGKMILSVEIAGDKLISSAKDNSMQLIDMPEYIVARSTPSQAVNAKT